MARRVSKQFPFWVRTHPCVPGVEQEVFTGSQAWEGTRKPEWAKSQAWHARLRAYPGLLDFSPPHRLQPPMPKTALLRRCQSPVDSPRPSSSRAKLKQASLEQKLSTGLTGCSRFTGLTNGNGLVSDMSACQSCTSCQACPTVFCFDLGRCARIKRASTAASLQKRA
jgi:hypothetical protein